MSIGSKLVGRVNVSVAGSKCPMVAGSCGESIKAVWMNGGVMGRACDP